LEHFIVLFRVFVRFTGCVRFLCKKFLCSLHNYVCGVTIGRSENTHSRCPSPSLEVEGCEGKENPERTCCRIVVEGGEVILKKEEMKKEDVMKDKIIKRVVNLYRELLLKVVDEYILSFQKLLLRIIPPNRGEVWVYVTTNSVEDRLEFLFKQKLKSEGFEPSLIDWAMEELSEGIEILRKLIK